MSERWTTIESDPGVFTELVEMIGVKDVQFEEIYSFSKETFSHLEPVYGLIFLFKYTGTKTDKSKIVNDVEGLYFANQTVPDACATQAILSVLLNQDNNIDIGDHLRDFKKNTIDLSNKLRGVAIGNDELIRRSHNSFRRPEGISVVDKFAQPSDEVYHFVSYIPFNGRLYELDGLQNGPIDHGECDEKNWLDVVIPIIENRIAVYSQAEVGFNLMAVIKNTKKVCLEEIEKLKVRKDELLSGDGMDVEGKDESIRLIDDEIEALTMRISNEEMKFEDWKKENIRRRHNYVPFLFNLLKVLAEKDKLMDLVDLAKKKAEERKKGSK